MKFFNTMSIFFTGALIAGCGASEDGSETSSYLSNDTMSDDDYQTFPAPVAPSTAVTSGHPERQTSRSDSANGADNLGDAAFLADPTNDPNSALGPVVDPDLVAMSDEGPSRCELCLSDCCTACCGDGENSEGCCIICLCQ